VTVVAGPSGAGKTTLLRLCNRLERPTAGRVLFRGEDVARLDPLALRRRIGMVFQRPTPFAGTVRENLRVAVPVLDDRAAAATLERVELDGDLLDRPAHDLSGGEAQRMCLARALVLHPEVLLMDEPTSSVDPRARLALERLGRDLARSEVPIVWVTHDLAQMRRLADHLLVLAAGRIEYSGPTGGLTAGATPAVRAFLASGAGTGEAADDR
jgi:putative ABC transport system ATP-binding protein